MKKTIVYDEKDASIEEICKVLAAGEIILYPTDTLYALGADPNQPSAMKKLFALKCRATDKKVSYIFSDIAQVGQYARLTDTARALSTHIPGKITIVLEGGDGAGETIGARVPDSEFCLALASAYGPVTATSANISGEEDLHTVGEILRRIPDGIALAIDGGALHGPASTVVDARGDTVKVLRQGSVVL